MMRDLPALMRDLSVRVYRWFRAPRRFLKFLVAFIVGSITFHRVAGYDPDFGITNLSLSIEASVASAGIILVLEEIMDRLFAFLREWRSQQERQDAAQAQVLEAVLQLARGQQIALERGEQLLRDSVERDKRTIAILERFGGALSLARTVPTQEA